jgi:hypothetical protein
VNVDLYLKQANESVENEKYKNWPDEAIADLGSIVDQVCNVKDAYMGVLGIFDNMPVSYYNHYRENPTVTKDNATDPFIRDYVIPDLLKVKMGFEY